MLIYICSSYLFFGIGPSQSLGSDTTLSPLGGCIAVNHFTMEDCARILNELYVGHAARSDADKTLHHSTRHLILQRTEQFIERIGLKVGLKVGTTCCIILSVICES